MFALPCCSFATRSSSAELDYLRPETDLATNLRGQRRDVGGLRLARPGSGSILRRDVLSLGGLVHVRLGVYRYGFGARLPGCEHIITPFLIAYVVWLTSRVGRHY